jgi:hypothetical protein
MAERGWLIFINTLVTSKYMLDECQSSLHSVFCKFVGIEAGRRCILCVPSPALMIGRGRSQLIDGGVP